MQSFAEVIPKFSVEDCVDDRVEGTVDITQPCDNADYLARPDTGLTESSGYVHHKERSPTEKESTFEKERGEK